MQRGQRQLTIIRTEVTAGGELETRWLRYLKKADTTAAAALRSLIKKACDEAQV